MNALNSQFGANAGRSANFNPSGNYLGVVVAILFLVNFVNYMDRMVLSVVIEPIRHELGLSDVQIGLLTGFAFAIFYGTAGLGISWLADRYNRKRIIAISLLGLEPHGRPSPAPRRTFGTCFWRALALVSGSLVPFRFPIQS